MVRITIQNVTWSKLFEAALLFSRHLKLTTYDSMRLAHQARSHKVLIQTPEGTEFQDPNLWRLHAKLLKSSICAELKELEGLGCQIDLVKFEPLRMGYPMKNGKILWASNPDCLIFRDIKPNNVFKHV